jgi:hypothetical protein
MAANNYVPSIDYTSRDYTSILSDMTTLIPNFSPDWTNRDPADFGMALLELFSYMGDILNYYIDRAANEAVLSSATQRQSVLNIARLIGYTPTDAKAATVTLTFQNATANPIDLPALTQVATSLVANATTAQVVYETDTAVTVPAKTGGVNGTVTVTASQGETIADEIVGISDGTANQSYTLLNTSVINNTVQVVINGVTYTRVDYLIDASGYDPVFETITDAEGITYVVFGDGVSGRIPPNGAQIYVTYRVGGGVLGNVATGTIKYVINIPSSVVPVGLTVLNQDVSTTGDGAASGGADEETTDSIRVNAPLSIRAINRAVSVSDYSYLAVQVAGVAKAISTADVYTSVTLYICPIGDAGVAADNTTPTSVFNSLATKVQANLVDKAPANTTVTFQPPKYVGVDLSVNITVSPTFKQSAVSANVNAALQNFFGIDNVVFNDTIAVADVQAAIGVVDGVAYQQITKMVRADLDQTYTINNKALTSNVATITTSASHTLTVGQTVSVTGVDTTFNGTFVVTAVTSNTFSYVLIATDVPSASASGAATALTVNDIVCAINEIPTFSAIPSIGNLTVNASGGITS